MAKTVSEHPGLFEVIIAQPEESASNKDFGVPSLYLLGSTTQSTSL